MEAKNGGHVAGAGRCSSSGGFAAGERASPSQKERLLLLPIVVFFVRHSSAVWIYLVAFPGNFRQERC